MIDQRKLPAEEVYVTHKDHNKVANSIKEMVIRGAPAIGIATAMGIALGVLNLEDDLPLNEVRNRFDDICSEIEETRPTAVNLTWSVQRMKKIFRKWNGPLDKLKKDLVSEALKIREEDIEINKRIGSNGVKLFKKGDGILTHCNTGGLATAGYGTALGVIRSCLSFYKDIFVYAGETRPFLQGSRLTAWELKKENIPFKLITDSMAGYLMQRGDIDGVIVGADRIAANGDTANKIGTYTLSILALHHKIPFYIAAPVSTIDLSIKDGSMIPIEIRSESEVLKINRVNIAPENVQAENPAFDVTPYENISAIITERGVLKGDLKKKISELF